MKTLDLNLKRVSQKSLFLLSPLRVSTEHAINGRQARNQEFFRAGEVS